VQAHVRKNVYEVFAQIEPGGPISHVGNLNAPGMELAKVYARRIYDEERWSEMWVVPRAEIHVALPDPSAPFGVAAGAGDGAAAAAGGPPARSKSRPRGSGPARA
jgi:1,2-phenylacetyl-CoA epoxidase PaaB subunit